MNEDGKPQQLVLLKVPKRIELPGVVITYPAGQCMVDEDTAADWIAEGSAEDPNAVPGEEA